MKVAWSCPAAVMAWLNRTGWRTLATQYSASSSGAVVASATVERNGMVGILGVEIRQRRTQLGQDRIHQRGMRGDLHVHPTRETILPLHRGDHGIDLRGGPAITVWRGEAYPARLTSG